MKNLKLIFVLMLVVFGSRLQAQGNELLQDYQLDAKQFAAWQQIKNNWLAGEYEIICSEQKVNLNCKSCNSFYIDVIFTINDNGKLESYQMVKGVKCGMSIPKELELRIMRNFIKFEFPHELRNLSFQTRLGQSLKC